MQEKNADSLQTGGKHIRDGRIHDNFPLIQIFDLIGVFLWDPGIPGIEIIGAVLRMPFYFIETVAFISNSAPPCPHS